jgi:hypothetical protein
MRKTGIFVILLAAMTACAGGGASSVSNTANTIAFSRTDSAQLAGSPAATDQKAENSVAATSNTSTNAPRRTTVGQAVVRQINLSKVEQVEESNYTADRKIIRNADIDLEADSPEESQRQIISIAERNGGFVVESQQSSSDVRINSRDIVTMSVRVPADKFSDALDEIRRTGTRVVVETVKGQDVTEEFIDIEAQLKAKKALEAQFMEIMKRASTIDSALEVQSQLADVRGEIERIEGRKRFLENQSAMSTIKVRVQTAKVFAASSTNFNDRLSEAFATGLNFATNFVLGLLTLVIGILPFAVFVGLPGVLIIRYLWKRQTRPRSIAEIAEEEIKND